MKQIKGILLLNDLEHIREGFVRVQRTKYHPQRRFRASQPDDHKLLSRLCGMANFEETALEEVAARMGSHGFGLEIIDIPAGQPVPQDYQPSRIYVAVP